MASTLISKDSAIRTEKELWENEFSSLRVIPSSTRVLPSKALQLFSELLSFHNLSVVLDAGCGTGRNAIYLAQKGCTVEALDFSETALSVLRRRAIDSGVSDRIHACSFPLSGPLGFPDAQFDLALDSYVSCHFVDEHLRRQYHAELSRVLKPGGHLFSSQFSVDDAYYARLLPSPSSGTGGIVTDPRNHITKRLYTEAEAQSLFQDQDEIELRYYTKFQFDDVVLGTTYRRSILVLIGRRRVE
jgi:SAM-dependent methyltransferase